MALYELTVDGDDAAVLSAEALIEAWGDSVPDLAARTLDLAIGANATIFRNPDVLVRRIR